MTQLKKKNGERDDGRQNIGGAMIREKRSEDRGGGVGSGEGWKEAGVGY